VTHRELVISAGSGEWRAALVENGVPVELRVERGDGHEAGSIYLGRVLRLLPSLGAALIDTGGERFTFLPQSEIFPRGRRLAEGERIVVQIRREAQGGKAAGLSTAVAVRGRRVELIAGRPEIFGAEALSPEDRANLLEAAGTAQKPRAEGETSAIGLRIIEPGSIDALVAEVKNLRHRCDDIAGRAAPLDPPARLHPAANFAAALVGVLPAIDKILVDEPAAVPEIRVVFPEARVAHIPEADWPFDLDRLFDETLSPTTLLAGGGSIHFEQTRAAVLIDVDTGTPETGAPQRVALAINLAASETIARQIRLRNLAGGIVIDFVGLDNRAARERVRTALTRALAADPLQPQILGWSRLGHLELVRRRRARSLADSLLEPASGGAFAKTAVTVAHEALRSLRREASAQPRHAWRLTVSVEVAAVLAGEAAGAVQALEQRFGRSVAIAADRDLDRDRFQLTPV
jgi:ribonuclease G